MKDPDEPRRASDQELIRRALAAYFRTAAQGAAVPDQPAAASSGVVEHEGKTYVVLANSYRTLAVYRVRTSGQLKRLRRWAKVIETVPPEPREGASEGRDGPAEEKE
jgi:uncharacterized iron-regulated membrane protein